MNRHDPKQPSESSDSARTRPGGQVGEKPASHTQGPPNKPGKYDADEQREARSELADVGQADEQTGGEDQRATDRPAEHRRTSQPTRH